MSDKSLLESMSMQLGELVRHVAEVRASNKRLESHVESMQSSIDRLRGDFDSMRADIDSMRGDIVHMRGDIDGMRGDIDHTRGDIATMKQQLSDLDAKHDERIDFLARKIDQSAAFLSGEVLRSLTRIDQVDNARSAADRKLEARLDAVEVRIKRLETAR